MYVCLFLLLYMYIHQFCFMKLALYFIYMLRAKAARQRLQNRFCPGNVSIMHRCLTKSEEIVECGI